MREQLAKFGTLVIGSALSCLPLILSKIRSTDTRRDDESCLTIAFNVA